MESLIHHGVKCSLCQKYPIIGIRFKCLQCNSYDLCETCEAKFGEKHGHILLKLRNNTQINLLDKKNKAKDFKLKGQANQKPSFKCVNTNLKFRTVNNNNFINIQVKLAKEGICNWPLPCFFTCEEGLSKIKGNRVKISNVKEPGDIAEFNIKLDLSNIKKTGNYPTVWNLRDENDNILSNNIIFFVNDIFKDKLRLKPSFRIKNLNEKKDESNPVKNYDYLV